jgi:hypothetical protein
MAIYFNNVLVNNNLSHTIPPEMSHLAPVLLSNPPHERYHVVGADVIDEQHPWRHDATKLANQLINWFKEVNQT